MKKLITVCVLSFLAFINAIYLTAQFYKIESAESAGNISSFCDISNSFSCTNVLASPYSQVFGLPFPAIAIAVYPIIFLVAFLGINGIIKKPYHILAFLGLGGMMFNGYFISMEYLYIKSYCPLCLACSVIITLIFILGVVGILEKKKKK